MPATARIGIVLTVRANYENPVVMRFLETIADLD